MSAFLIAFTCMCMAIVTWVAFASVWIVKQLRWLRAVLVPWMNSLSKAVNPDKK